MTWSMGSELLIDIWQPALLLRFALVALTIAVACGGVIMLPVWVGVASLIVQTHVAYVYAVGVLVVVVTASLVLQLRAARGDARWASIARRVLRAKAFLWTLVVLALAWIQPLWEQLFGKGEGNLQRLATHAGEGDLTVARDGSEDRLGGRGVTAMVVSVGSRTRSATRMTGTRPCSFPICKRHWRSSVCSSVLLLIVLIGPATLISGRRMACVVSMAMLVVAVAGLSVQAVTHRPREPSGAVAVQVSVIVRQHPVESAESAARRWSRRTFSGGGSTSDGVVLALRSPTSRSTPTTSADRTAARGDAQGTSATSTASIREEPVATVSTISRRSSPTARQ